MHWSRSGVETFVILDEGTTYRYRTSSTGTHADEPPADGTTAADRNDLHQSDQSTTAAHQNQSSRWP